MKTQDHPVTEPPRNDDPSTHGTPPRERAPIDRLSTGDGYTSAHPALGVPFRPSNERLQRRSRRPWKVAGADLKQQYRLTLLIAFVLALGLFVGLTHVSFRFDGQAETVVLEAQEVVQMQEIQQTEQTERVPLPPRPTPPVEVPNDQIIEDEPLNLDASLDLNEALDVPSAPPPPPEPEKNTTAEESNEIFVAVEEKPELIGGTAFLYKQIEYPTLARQAGVQGRVIVQFVVNKEGEVVDPKVLQSPHPLLSEEALRVIQLAKFKPGRQRSRPVNVQMAIPITFRLKDYPR